MESGETCITVDNKFPTKRTVKKKKKKIKAQLKEEVSPNVEKKASRHESFHVLMCYPRNTPQMLTQFPCLVLSNFREQLFCFPVTVLEKLHSFSRMDEGLLLTN